MPQLSPQQIIFIAINALIGLVVGTAAVRSPWFADLGIPTFAWLVAGMFLLELLAGLALRTHPSNIVSMPVRIAALVASIIVCAIVMGALKVA